MFGLLILAIIPLLLMFTHKELAPEEDQGIVFLIANAPQPSNLNYLNAYTADFVNIFKSFPEYYSSFQINGSDGVQAGIGGFLLKPWAERERTQMELLPLVQARLDQIPGLQIFGFNLPSLPGTGDGLLDLAGGVFIDIQPCLDAGDYRRATRLAELERGVGVLRHEHLLDAHGHRTMGANHLADAAKDDLQALGQRPITRANAARGHVLATAPGIANHAVTGDARAGIDAKDQGHAAARSIADRGRHTVYLSSREYRESRWRRHPSP